MPLSIIAWLMGSKVGRYVALGLLITALIAVAVWRIYAAGQAREQARQAEAALKALRERIKVDDEVARMAPADRRKRLSEWVRDNDL